VHNVNANSNTIVDCAGYEREKVENFPQLHALERVLARKSKLTISPKHLVPCDCGVFGTCWKRGLMIGDVMLM
jgi:hypothetical protein